MRFMLIVNASLESEAGVMPSAELLGAMGAFNQEMIDAGILKDAAGLQASSKGARIHFSDEKRTAVDGPFPLTEDLIAGFWIIDVASKQEAIDWMMRCPNPHPGHNAKVDIRQFFEMSDFE